MNARRLGLITGLLFMASYIPHIVLAQGQKYYEPQPVFQSEGRNPIAFSVNCATATWTLVIASDTISRSTLMESISSNTVSICLSPSVTSSSQCVTGTPGPELSPNSSLTDYSHVAWYCSASSGTTSQTIKGYRTRDKGDYGIIGSAPLQ